MKQFLAQHWWLIAAVILVLWTIQSESRSHPQRPVTPRLPALYAPAPVA